jgi:hypothetical protein
VSFFIRNESDIFFESEQDGGQGNERREGMKLMPKVCVVQDCFLKTSTEETRPMTTTVELGYNVIKGT